MIKGIVAMDSHGLIGNESGLPWHIKEELQHFKQTTLYQSILMGKKTFDTIQKPLPNRTTYVLTHQDIQIDGVLVIHDIKDILSKFQNSTDTLWICGGKSIYEQFGSYMDELLVSKVKGNYKGNVYFPLAILAHYKFVETIAHEKFTVERYLRND